MIKRSLLAVLFITAAAMMLASCAGMQTTKATEANFKAPVITLESVEARYDGWWYYAKTITPTKGDAGDNGAPLAMSFLFNIQNPNSYPVRLEGVKFMIAFDKEFDMFGYHNTDASWIPPGKTNQVRANATLMPNAGLLGLLVTGGYKLKAKGWSAWDALERWWKGVPDFSVPVTVREGAFTFSADGVVKVLPFEATYP
jgi:hypothetical protein